MTYYTELPGLFPYYAWVEEADAKEIVEMLTATDMPTMDEVICHDGSSFAVVSGISRMRRRHRLLFLSDASRSRVARAGKWPHIVWASGSTLR